MFDLQGPDAAGVFILKMNDGKENRFTAKFFDGLFAALDKVEANKGPTALVVTGAGKFFSNGFDFDFLQTGGAAPLIAIHKTFERMLNLSVPSVMAVNGHAFAGGAMLALCGDYRIMNADKGFLCVNELQLGLAFTDPMLAVFDAKLPTQLRVPVVMGAERIGAARLAHHGAVDEAVPAAQVLDRARAVAASHAKKGADKALYRKVKGGIYAAAIRAIEEQKTKPIPLPPKVKPAKL